MKYSGTVLLICPVFRLQHIALVQFRNYAVQSFDFPNRIMGICGSNGSGKTNLLDAIYYLSFSRSYFSRPDTQNVHHGTQGLRLQGDYTLNGQAHTVTCILRENNRKELSLDQTPYKKFSDHIGRFPAVMIAPDDIELVAGPAEERRKQTDTLLSQISPPYLQQLIDYNKLLQQRNSLLKQAAETGMLDEALLGILDEQLARNGDAIYAHRKAFFAQYIPLVQEIYQRIAGNDNGISLRYESHLEQTDTLGLLRQNRSRDRILQRTSAGIHRDDLVLMMGESPFRSTASQGQRKSLLFAIKLAEWQVLREQKGFNPILLLDDVFEKLDEARMQQLLQWVCTESDGQVFITDTHPERMKQQLAATGMEFGILEMGI